MIIMAGTNLVRTAEQPQFVLSVVVFVDLPVDHPKLGPGVPGVPGVRQGEVPSWWPKALWGWGL